MKQYLQTIMRSLCVMLMLCGISTSAWADEWSDYFSLENSEEDMSDTNPYIINDWENFYNNASGDSPTISTEGVYFKLNDDLVMSYTPSSTLQISQDQLDMNGHTISIGESSSLVDYPGWAYFHELFNDTDLEANVTYHYSLTESQWSEFISNQWWEKERVYFYLYENIVIESAPTGSLDFDTDHFNFNNCTLTVGEDNDPVDFPLSSFYAVFNDPSLEANVNYTFSISTVDEWDYFVSANNSLDPERVKIIFTDDVTLTSLPGEPITFSNIDFASDCELYIGDGNENSSTDILQFQNPVFGGAAASLNNSYNVIYNLTITSQEGIQKLYDNKDFFYGKSFYVYPESTTSTHCYDLTGYDFTGEDSNPLYYYCLVPDGEDEDDPVKFINADGKGACFSLDSGSDSEDEKYIVNYSAPSCYLVNTLLNGALFDKNCRGTKFEDTCDYDFNSEVVFINIGSGTDSSPYLIYNYEMLAKLIEIVNAADEDYTSGMYIQLASDINAQGNERLTGIDGTITLSGYEQNTLQFPEGFKGHFDGNKHSIGGMTQPLFSSLDGATIENLGIVDCNMSDPALATSASNFSTITNSYVSGVSAGLIPSNGITATDCYAWNTSTKVQTTYSLPEENTVADISGTHNILKDNCYTLTDGVYSDCTLFIPKDNTFYEVSPSGSDNSTSFFTWDSGSTETYMYYINLGYDFLWIYNPVKSNVSMLHNVVYRDGWLNNNTNGDTQTNVGGIGSLDYLYSWYVVDKKPCDVSALEKSSELGMCCRVKNIYYSRNSTNVIPKTPAPDGLNTIYLPFAWNPATDLYYTNSDEEEELIDDAKVHILADKLTETTDGFAFNDDVNYKDYSMEKSLLFFDPANTEVDNSERYDKFAGVSNALPTLLEIPEGKSGWYIKRSELANFFTPRNDSGDYDKNSPDAEGLDNLYNNYWEDQVNATGDNLKIGRSFMEIDRLGKDWENWGSGSGDYSNYTRTIHYTCEDKGYGISGCDNPKPINKTEEAERYVGDSNGSEDIYIYKANENGDIAIEGDDKPLIIHQVDPTVNGSDYQLKIYQANDNGEIAYIEGSEEPVFLHETDGSDIIQLDDDGNPSIIYISEQKINILSIESDFMTGEVVFGEGDLHGKVVIMDESSNYPVEIQPYETQGNDRIVLDSEGYPAEIRIENSVTIKITRENGTITGEVVSGEGDLHDNVIIEDEQNCYPIKLHVCGGHEEDEPCTWDGSDFPGRAYHLGTFTGIAKETFADGKYSDYSCYKLNSAGDGFAKVTTNSSVQPFRTFFAIAPGPDTDVQYSDLAPALKLGFCGIYDDSEDNKPEQPTNIDGAPVQGIHLMTTDESKVYSIDGRYVGQYGNKKLAPGMYIMNGKKFVVK